MHRSFPLLLPVLAFAFSAAFPGAAAADALLSLNGTINSTGTPAGDATPATKSSFVTAGFTIDAGPAHLFSGAIAYGIADGGPAAGGSVTYSTGSLWLGTTTSPTTLEENLTTVSVSGTTYTFDVPSALTLTGGDTYWLIINLAKQQLRSHTSTEESSGPDATYVGLDRVS